MDRSLGTFGNQIIAHIMTQSLRFTDPWYGKAGFIYFVAAGRPPVAIKIGVTQQSTLKRRLKSIQSANHEYIELLGVISFSEGDKPLLDAEAAERALHQRFQAYQRFISSSVGSEWFTSSNELIEYISTNCIEPETLGLPRSVAKAVV
jgi:hypothetical protein